MPAGARRTCAGMPLGTCSHEPWGQPQPVGSANEAIAVKPSATRRLLTIRLNASDDPRSNHQ
eukprot:4148510-Pyramimonas_sp.AAC.1